MKRRKFHEWLPIFKTYNVKGRVSRSYVTPEGDRLGVWVEYVDKVYDRLSEEKKKMLEDVGYKRIGTYRDDIFDKYYEEFKVYNVDGDVERYFVTPSGVNLGNWVQRIRMGLIVITPERRAKLDAVNFKWHGKRGPKPK